MNQKQTNGWKQARLGEFFRIKHGWAFKGEFFADAGPFVLLTPGNFNEEGGLRLKGEKEKYYTGEVPPEYILKRGNLLVVMTEQAEGLLGSPAIIPEGDRYLHNQRLGLVVDMDESLVDKLFLYYLFNLREVRAQIRATANGAKVRHTSPSRIYEVKVKLPPLAYQRGIASVLAAYDSLIENNTRRIKILEEMARTIYREWFVHFRFPGHEKVKLIDSPLGKIPEGWNVLTLGDVLQEIESGSRPKGGIDAEERGVPSIGAENVLGLGQYDYSKEKFVSQRFYESMRRGHVQNRDILLYKDGAQIGRKTILGDGFPHETCCINEHVFALRTNDRCTQAYLFFWLDQPDMTQAICNLNANAAQPGLNQMSIKGLPIILPPKPILDEFDKPANQALGLIFNLAKKTNVLRGTRDLLLPKLMSGGIPVPDLESFPEKALT